MRVLLLIDDKIKNFSASDWLLDLFKLSILRLITRGDQH